MKSKKLYLKNLTISLFSLSIKKNGKNINIKLNFSQVINEKIQKFFQKKIKKKLTNIFLGPFRCLEEEIKAVRCEEGEDDDIIIENIMLL